MKYRTDCGRAGAVIAGLAVTILLGTVAWGRFTSVEEVPVQDDGNDVLGLDPDWSSDLAPKCDVRGDRVVYVSSDRSTIYTQRRTKLGDFADQIQQTNASGVTFSNPRWDTDGLRVAYEKTVAGVTTIEYIETEVDSSSGTYPTPVAVPSESGFHYFNPRWSSQGVLVYEKADDDTSPTDVEIVSYHAGCGEKVLVSNELVNLAPDWSPDGSRIVFVKEEVAGNQDRRDLYLVSGQYAVGDNDYVNPAALTDDTVEDSNPRFGEEAKGASDPDDLHDFVIYEKRAAQIAQTDPWKEIYDIFPDVTSPTERLLTDTSLAEFPADHNHLSPQVENMNPRLVLYVKQNADASSDSDPEYEIIFRLRRPEFHDSNEDAAEVQVTDLGTGGVEELPTGSDPSIFNQNPSFAPSSQNLIYVKRELLTDDPELFYVDIEE